MVKRLVLLVLFASLAKGQVLLFSGEGVSLPVPDVPTLSSPADAATDVATNPTFSWNVAANASTYRLQVDDNSNFSSPLIDQSGISSTSYNASGLANNTVYYWHVLASNTTGNSAYSTSRSFTTVAASGFTLQVTDNFTRADGALGASYTTWAIQAMLISSNGIRDGTIDANNAGFFYSGRSWTADQKAELTIVSVSSGADFVGPAVRCSGTNTTANGYAFISDGGSGANHSMLVRLDNGAETLLQNITMTCTTSDILGLEIIGTTLKCYKNGTQVGTDQVDATYATGSIGGYSYRTNNVVQADDLKGYDHN